MTTEKRGVPAVDLRIVQKRQPASPPVSVGHRQMGLLRIDETRWIKIRVE
jgi:hypothetical protein